MDIALGLCGAEAARFPLTSAFEAPFAITDARSGSAMLWRAFETGALGHEYDPFKVLALALHNPGSIHTVSRKVVKPDDLRGVRLRSPNPSVSAALHRLGAVAVPLQVDRVMPALTAGEIDGIVTNWGNPLPGFVRTMRFHLEIGFYTSVFFILMNRARYHAFSPSVRGAFDGHTGAVLSQRFAELWDVWDRPVRAAAIEAGNAILVPDPSLRALWRRALGA